MPHLKRNINLLLVILLPIIGFLLGWTLSSRSHTGQINTDTPSTTELPSQTPEITKPPIIKKKVDPKDVNLKLLWETWDELERNFLYQDRFESQEQLLGAISGMVESLEDPHTVFMTPKETQLFDESINGEFEGIGAEIEIKNDALTVVSPLKGSPAEKAGLLAGDIIAEINAESSLGLNIFEAVSRIKGKKGTPVVLSVLREGEVLPIEITIVRDSITLKALEWEMKDDRIAHISISQFSNGLSAELQNAIAEVIIEEPAGIIIDLRNNGGGILDEAVNLSTQFLDRKKVVETRGRTFGSTGGIVTRPGGSFLEVPLVVLINRGSASASEIFAGAIKDHNRGVLIGEKTFGKGTVQHIIQLSDGASLKVTIAEWLTPNGTSISENGITPDVALEITEDSYKNGQDPVLQKAIQVLKDEYQTILDQKEA